MTLLGVTVITADPDCQPRIAVDPRIVDEYADDMAGGAGFPPLTVYHDGETYWLADGFHRLAAAMRLGLAEIECELRTGTKRDAILHSCGANANHGMRRSNGDKRRAIESLLSDAEWSKWSDREIARRCGVSNDFVSRTRSSLSSNDSDTRTYTDRWGNVRTMDTSNIGRAVPEIPWDGPTPSAEPGWGHRLPEFIPADVADDMFPDADAYVPDTVPPLIEWNDADGQAFALLQRAMHVIDRDPVAVAYAAFGTNPLGASLYAKRAEQMRAWFDRFTGAISEIR